MALGAPQGTGAEHASAEGPLAIRARGLVAAHGLVPVIRDLDLDIPAGVTVALLGGNGTGKSTLLRLLAGLRSPRRGELAVLGHPLPADRWAIRGRVGVVAHHPLLYRELTIAENLHYHARLHRLPPSRVEAVIDQADLRERAGQPVGALSRGLVQRASVARALLSDPELLLLDEPLANLDPVVAALVGDLLGPREGRTRVIASHDPERALAESDLAIVLGAGAAVRHVGPVGGLTVADVEAMYR